MLMENRRQIWLENWFVLTMMIDMARRNIKLTNSLHRIAVLIACNDQESRRHIWVVLDHRARGLLARDHFEQDLIVHLIERRMMHDEIVLGQHKVMALQKKIN